MHGTPKTHTSQVLNPQYLSPCWLKSAIACRRWHNGVQLTDDNKDMSSGMRSSDDKSNALADENVSSSGWR